MKNKVEFLIWFNNWIESRRLKGIIIDIREYQPEKIWEIITIIPNKKFVLAASPNSGKTLMSIIYVDWCIYNNSNFKALILTHGTDILRSQYKSEAELYKADFLNNKNIIIDLPHSVKKKFLLHLDLIIVDEAHQFYFAENGMIENLIKKYKPEHELLLTGTPSDFIMYNKLNSNNKYHISCISMLDLWNLDIIQDVLIEVGSTTYNYLDKDYNSNGDLNSKIEISEEKIVESMNEMMDSIMRKLRSRIKHNPEVYNKTEIFSNKSFFPINKMNIGKTMIACRNTKEASYINKFLLNYGYTEKNIIQSTSDLGNSEGIQDFKENKELKFLIVVYRGILGFNYSELVNIIDLTGSKNVNRILQLYCRLIRKSKNNLDKFYYKISPNHLAEYFSKFMTGVLHLSHEHYLLQYDGKNFNDLQIVPINQTVSKLNIKNINKNYNINNSKLVQLNLEYVFDMHKLYHKGDNFCESIVYITLNEVMIKLGLASKNWTNASLEECEKELEQLFIKYSNQK